MSLRRAIQIGGADNASLNGSASSEKPAGEESSHWIGRIVSKSELVTLTNVSKAERAWVTILGAGSPRSVKIERKSGSAPLSGQAGWIQRSPESCSRRRAAPAGWPLRAITTRQFSNSSSTSILEVTYFRSSGPTYKSTSPDSNRLCIGWKKPSDILRMVSGYRFLNAVTAEGIKLMLEAVENATETSPVPDPLSCSTSSSRRWNSAWIPLARRTTASPMVVSRTPLACRSNRVAPSSCSVSRMLRVSTG